MEKYKPGDLVKVKDGTHQDGMPDHRVGMVVEVGETSKSYTKAYTIVFLGTDLHLKFHEMFLEPFTTS
jgi:ribosomal protein L21E